MYKRITIEKDLIIKETPTKIYPYFSRANEYLKVFNHVDRSANGKTRDYINAVIKFLNYLEEMYQINFENDLESLQFSHFQSFLDFYCLSQNEKGDFPGNEARKRMRRFISLFALNLKESNVCKDLINHYIVIRNLKAGKRYSEYELRIQNTKSQVNREVYRFCPEYFVEECLKQSRLHDIDVFMRICLQIDAGLRPSETGNVRQKTSKYGAGYRIVYSSDKANIISMRIDLSKEERERPLRSDGKPVGGIKKPRWVDVLPQNVDHLLDAIQAYEKATKDRVREDTKPLITNSYKTNGYNMAQTYDSYRMRFKHLVSKYVIPELIKQGGEKKMYAETLDSMPYGPHFFREYFTVKMVENGYDWQDVMKYRGDKSPDSAITYCLKGGAFDSSIQATNGMLVDALNNYPNRKEALNERTATIPKLL